MTRFRPSRSAGSRLRAHNRSVLRSPSGRSPLAWAAEAEAAARAEVGQARQEIPGAASELHVVVEEAPLDAVVAAEADARVAGRCAHDRRVRELIEMVIDRRRWKSRRARRSAYRRRRRSPWRSWLLWTSGTLALEGAQLHVVVDVARHQHQAEPAGRRVHQVEHVHLVRPSCRPPRCSRPRRRRRRRSRASEGSLRALPEIAARGACTSSGSRA